MRSVFAPYVLYFLLFLTAACVLLCFYPKLELHLLMNEVHNGLLDVLFKTVSTLAESPFYVVAILPLLFWRAGWTYLYAMSEVSAALFIFIVKRIVNMPRPVTCFADHPELLKLVPGVRMRAHYSFPSGHTSSFFVFFTVVALLLMVYYYRKQQRGESIGSRWLIYLLLLLLACLGGYSRIYLSQHFMMDIFAGSMVGFTFACTSFYLFYSKGWMGSRWFNRSLFGRNGYYRTKRSSSEL